MIRLRGQFATLIALFVLLAACGSTAGVARGPELASITPDGLVSALASSELPTVVNIWASWCIPCRSEAPLLRQADEAFDGRVEFIGVAVGDRQDSARDFIAEFGIEFVNYFDEGRAVPASLSRTGVPLTFFFDTEGNLIHSHSGVIDERTLAVNIDELLAR